jgi:UDP-N-acetylglucosamine 2-epimerase (non-hydrolysing)
MPQQTVSLSRPDVLVVYGTRPEASKLVSVVEAMRALGLSVAVCATGQHADLVDLALVARLAPAYALGVNSDGRMPRFLHDCGNAVSRLLGEVRPRAVLVQGDTASAYAAAKEAWRAGVPVAHVEAGVRSYAREPWPEERFRVQIDEMATWRFAATEHAARNLAREGLGASVTGQTGLDVLRAGGWTPQAEASPARLLVTLHRRELRERADAPALLQALADALCGAAVDVVWPVHPAMVPLVSGVRWPRTVALVPPMAQHAVLAALAGARGLLTDSGGLVEEACWFGVPTAIWRNANDRPEACAAGIAQTFRLTPDDAPDAVHWVARDRGRRDRRGSDVYGDGQAGERVATALAAALGVTDIAA